MKKAKVEVICNFCHLFSLLRNKKRNEIGKGKY